MLPLHGAFFFHRTRSSQSAAIRMHSRRMDDNRSVIIRRVELTWKLLMIMAVVFFFLWYTEIDIRRGVYDICEWYKFESRKGFRGRWSCQGRFRYATIGTWFVTWQWFGNLKWKSGQSSRILFLCLYCWFVRMKISWEIVVPLFYGLEKRVVEWYFSANKYEVGS